MSTLHSASRLDAIARHMEAERVHGGAPASGKSGLALHDEIVARLWKLSQARQANAAQWVTRAGWDSYFATWRERRGPLTDPLSWIAKHDAGEKAQNVAAAEYFTAGTNAFIQACTVRQQRLGHSPPDPAVAASFEREQALMTKAFALWAIASWIKSPPADFYKHEEGEDDG